MFNYESNNQSPRDPYSLLEVIHEGLCADNPASLQGVIFCTDQSDETGKEKPGMHSLYCTGYLDLTLGRLDRPSYR
jgi:hypothetical protein